MSGRDDGGIAAGSQRTQAAAQGRWARTKQWLHRARSDGYERHTLTSIAKSALAATVC